MQNCNSTTENNFAVENYILQIYRVKVLLEPITQFVWYEMKREQQNLPNLIEADIQSCSFCLDKFDSSENSTYARCLDCDQAEVLICITCLRMGMESPPHNRSHRYVLNDNIGPILFDEGPNSWGAQEDLQLLTAFLRGHLDQWPVLSKDFGRKRTLTEALERLDRCFLRDQIGQYVLKDIVRHEVQTWDEQGLEEVTSCVFSNKLQASSSATFINDFDKTDLEFSSSPLMRRDSDTEIFTEKEKVEGEDVSENECDRESSSELIGLVGRRLSTKSTGEESVGSLDQKKSRKEQLLAVAKNVAAEAVRGKTRKTSLELSEAINLEGKGNGSRSAIKAKNDSLTDEFLNNEEVIELAASASFNPYFYNYPPKRMDPQTIAKFDEEDLQLLTYLPFREEFEHEYKNEAEQLISGIIFPNEGAELSDIDAFLNEVRYARFNRYNRLMRIRAAKRAILLEHSILNEYLNIVKNHISEKGKYSVFGGRYFNSKNKEDLFRPIFTQMRQITDRETVNVLAKNIGSMETLKDQIDELKELQQNGVIRLKGRLKVDSTPVVWSKKRKSKKSENAGQKKAGLRWKRIKRWTKKTHQHEEVE